MIDDELANLIGLRPGEDQDTAIRRYVRETQNAYGALQSRTDAAEQELKRIRKMLRRTEKTLVVYANPDHWRLGAGIWEWADDSADPWTSAEKAMRRNHVGN